MMKNSINIIASLECKQMAEAIGDIVCDWDEYRIKAVKRGKLNVFSILARTTDLLLKKRKNSSLSV